MIKNILWIGLLLFSLTACSDDDEQQTVTAFDVIMNGKVLDDNAKVTVTDVSTENGFPLMSFIVSVKNNQKTAIEVSIEKKDMSVSEGSSSDFCWGDKCYTSGNPSITIGGGVTENSFHASYVPEKNGKAVIKYVFAEKTAGGYSRSVEVTYNYTAE